MSVPVGAIDNTAPYGVDDGRNGCGSGNGTDSGGDMLLIMLLSAMD